MYRCAKAAALPGFAGSLTRFMRDGPHPKSLAAITQHLRHEGKALNAAALVERGQDFLLAAHFDDVSRTKA
jgi:hypothetical protein